MTRRFWLEIIISLLFLPGCATLGKLSHHSFESDYYTLKVKGAPPEHVYTEVIEDSVILYRIRKNDRYKTPDISASTGMRISRIKPGDKYSGNVFTKYSVDADITTLLFKLRHSMDDVPNQFSADLNFAIFAGIRKDLFRIVSPVKPLHEQGSFIRQIGFDFGLFAGIGSTPVNSTVTNNKTSQEYDAMVFQKGIAGFVSLNKMSAGLAVGFDTLVDRLSSSWIYNRKPYFGLIISVSGF